MTYPFESQLNRLEDQIKQQLSQKAQLSENARQAKLELDQTIAKMALLTADFEERSKNYQDEIADLQEENERLNNRLKKIISRLECLNIEL